MDSKPVQTWRLLNNLIHVTQDACGESSFAPSVKPAAENTRLEPIASRLMQQIVYYSFHEQATLR